MGHISGAMSTAHQNMIKITNLIGFIVVHKPASRIDIEEESEL